MSIFKEILFLCKQDQWPRKKNKLRLQGVFNSNKEIIFKL